MASPPWSDPVGVLTRTRGRPLLVPAVSTMVMLAILLTLGFWQVRRLAWKTDILAQISRAEALPPVPLSADPPEFAKVRATGIWRPDLQALYGAEVRTTRAGEQLGAQLVMPLMRDGAPPLLVDRGWVSTTPPMAVPTPPGVVSVDGFVRAPSHAGLFSAPDNPARHLFYTLDPAAIGASLGLGAVAPLTLVALGDPPAGTYPEPARNLPRPPNDHLEYAVTWFGLAAALLVIFAVYARKVLRP